MAIFLPSAIAQIGASPFSGAVIASEGLPGAAARGRLLEADRDGGPDGAPRGAGSVFGGLLEDARDKDVQAQRAIEAFARSDDPGRLHETMVAVSKSEIALRTVVAVRNKLLDAYRDLQHVTA